MHYCLCKFREQVYSLLLVVPSDKGHAESTWFLWYQVKGEVKVSEYSSIDPEEYSFEVTVAAADSGTTAAANLKAAVQGLEEQIFSRLQQYVAELNEL